MAQMPQDSTTTTEVSSATAERCLVGVAVGQLSFSINVGWLNAKAKMHEMMAPSCHADLDSAARLAHLSDLKLYRACRSHALTEDAQGRLQRSFIKTDYTLCVLVTLVLTVAFIFFSYALLTSPYAQSKVCTVSIILTGLLWACVYNWSVTWWPQTTARRAMRVLQIDK